MRRVIATGLILLITATSLSAQAIDFSPLKEKNQNKSDYFKGLLEGEANAKPNGLWFFAGFGLGIFGVAAAYLIKPDPPAYNLIGRNQDYILGYSEGYGDTCRKVNVEFACAGAVLLIVTIAIVASK